MPDLAWFHCFSGVAGDMALGALVDAGADLAEVEAIVRRVDLAGWKLEAEPVLRGGVAATEVHVHQPDHHDHHHRTWATIRGLLADAGLPLRVEQRARAAFGALAVAEGGLHRTSPDDVQFHEVGAVDAIVDIVGVCAALEVLGIDEVRCSPIAVGLGTVRAAHGVLPNPAPAVVALLAAVAAPSVGVDVPVELTTPTGAALMTTLAAGFGPLPPVEVAASGFGAGTADPDGRVNATQVVLGRVAAPLVADGPGQPVVLVEATLDDATGEALADTVGAVLAAGAHDCWLTPVVMKKGRPGHVVSALADVARAAAVREAVRTTSGSLGVRATMLDRWPARRSFAEVAVDGHAVAVKVSPVRVKAEHDDVLRVAAATGRSPLEVAARAEAAWWASQQP